MIELPHRTPVDDDLTKLDDPAFLDVCRRVRSLRESTKPDEVTPELAKAYSAVNREYLRRAGIAWRSAV